MNEPAGMPAPRRRVVTGVNPSGKSVIVSDGPIPEHASHSESGMGIGSEIWMVRRVPANLQDQSDPLDGYTLRPWPYPGEIMARIFTWLPGFEFPMHRSDTVDIFFVITGQIELILDEESTVLKSGETVIQRGTNHGWRVVGKEPCTFAGVLIDAAQQSSI